jgi:hypothetical protein
LLYDDDDDDDQVQVRIISTETSHYINVEKYEACCEKISNFSLVKIFM